MTHALRSSSRRHLHPRSSRLASALAVVAFFAGCDSSSGGPSITPDAVEAWPGGSVRLRVQDFPAGEVSWHQAEGSWRASGTDVRFPAPGTPGDYVLHAEGAASPERDASVTVHVRGVTREQLVVDARAAESVRGRLGSVTFEARRTSDHGAIATFHFADRRSGPSVVEAEVVDGTQGTLRIDALSLDGRGALAPAEEEALQALSLDADFAALALVPLELACDATSAEAPVLAALALPWQAVSKYETADRLVQVAAFERAASCRHLTADAGSVDTRAAAAFPLLSRGRPVPAVFGYLPFDVEGALAPAATAPKLTDVNVYGPGGSICRGACGPDCEETNCGEPEETWRCDTMEGRNTGYKRLWRRYTCGEHPGCIEHDACFDSCNSAHGAGSWDAGFCMRVCDLEAASGYGPVQGLEWALGHGPFTHERSYEYGSSEPVRDEVLCPSEFGLSATPSSGLAPLSATLRWNAPSTLEGACSLDPGDGTPAVVIEPCAGTGELAHVYAVPSALRSSADVYTATLSHQGNVVAQADVQARWTFSASQTSGPADLSTSFSWEGLAGVTTPLTCTLDFGDGAPAQTISDCAHASPVPHVYGEVGTYVALLTVQGEARSATGFATLVVTQAVTGYVGNAHVDQGVIQVDAQVTWTQSEDFGGVVQYLPTGTVTYAYAGCTVSPSSHAIGPDDGYMEIDSTYDPPRYYGGGVTSWDAVLTCGESSYDYLVVAQWFEGSAIHDASPDGRSLVATNGAWSWSFERTP